MNAVKEDLSGYLRAVQHDLVEEYNLTGETDDAQIMSIARRVDNEALSGYVFEGTADCLLKMRDDIRAKEFDLRAKQVKLLGTLAFLLGHV